MTPSSAAVCSPTEGQAHHCLLSLNWRLFHLFISSFLPSFSHGHLFWLIIPPLQKKKQPPACRRRFFAIYSQNLLLPIPEGCRKAALEAAKATTKTEVVHSIVSLKSTTAKSPDIAYIFILDTLKLFSCWWLLCSFQYALMIHIRPMSTFSNVSASFNIKSMNPLGKIQLQSKTWPVVEWDL